MAEDIKTFYSGLMPLGADGMMIVHNLNGTTKSVQPYYRGPKSGLIDGVYEMSFKISSDNGDPIPLTFGSNLPNFSPGYCGSGPFSRGQGASVLANIENLLPGEVRVYPCIISLGTYLGSAPFRTIQANFPFSQCVEDIIYKGGGNKDLDRKYGVDKWHIYLSANFPLIHLRVVFGSYDYTLTDQAYGYAGHFAQKQETGLFPVHPLLLHGSFSIYYDVSPESPYEEFDFHLYHEVKTLSTITPPHGTLLPRIGSAVITATPYPFHTLISFIIKGSSTNGYIEKVVPIVDPYGTTEFKWDLDNYTMAEWLTDQTVGSIKSDVHVTAISQYTGTKSLAAGSSISIQCNTNECCSPVWEILSTDASSTWGLSIDSNGLITGTIPQNETLGVYYIEVKVTGLTQSTSARVYVEVTGALIYGNVWIPAAKLDSNITGLVENGGYVYACTYEGKLYRAAITDLTVWTECTYVGVVTGAFGAITKVHDNLLCAMEVVDGGLSKLWTCTDGLLWTRGTTNYSGYSTAPGQLFKVNTAVVLWTQSYPSYKVSGPIMQLIDATADTLIETASLNLALAYSSRVPEAIFDAITGRFIYQIAYTSQGGQKYEYQYGESGITATGIPINPIPLENTITDTNGSMANPIMFKDGEYTWAPASDVSGIYLRTSTDGVNWVITTIDLSSTFRLYPLSAEAPIVVQLRVDNNSNHLCRTTDRWASVNVEVLADDLGSIWYSSMPMIELEGSKKLVFGCGGAVSNIYTSEA